MSLIRYADAEIPTAHGPLRVFVYRAPSSVAGAPDEEHVAIVAGDVAGTSNVLVRVHSECWTSEVLGSLKCDCREQLDAAIARIAADGADTVEANLALGFEADERRYDLAAAILKDLGVRSIRLLTNNPTKVAGLRTSGVVISERISHWVGENQYNSDYLAVKRRKMGHHPDTKVRLRALPSARKG